MTPFGFLQRGMAPLFNFGIAPRASRGATAIAPRTARIPLSCFVGGDIPFKLPIGCEPQLIAYYALPPSIAIQGQPAFVPPQLTAQIPNPYTRPGVST